MLPDHIVEEIEAEARQYPERRAACIEALKIVQRERGWVSDQSLREVADLLGMSPAELDNVATFYNLIYRQPVGRQVILLCDSVSCWVMGQEDLRAAIGRRLGIDFGQTTPDGEFTLLPMACLGACDRAPCLMLNEALHQDVTPALVERLLPARREAA
jgi:NADH-quinone oxidoreductase subunit E